MRKRETQQKLEEALITATINLVKERTEWAARRKAKSDFGPVWDKFRAASSALDAYLGLNQVSKMALIFSHYFNPKTGYATQNNRGIGKAMIDFIYKEFDETALAEDLKRTPPAPPIPTLTEVLATLKAWDKDPKKAKVEGLKPLIAGLEYYILDAQTGKTDGKFSKYEDNDE